MAAIVLRPFSGNFTGSETLAVKNSEEVLSYFFSLKNRKKKDITRLPPLGGHVGGHCLD
jgi:hypothetical protein